ncbi:MAG TPA: hypothetical protein VLC48_07045, partial [Gemmatimonadota bacterium]|nr:hypothetical protein [Gemmatimonadota bacterium]
PGAEGLELSQYWLPEIRIDLNVFIALRTRAEEILLLQEGLLEDSVLEVWDVDVFEDADSSYAVLISQRSRAANLAAVRQVSLAIHNTGATPATGELWVDDIRLDAPTDNVGIVGRVNANLRASDVLDLSFSYSAENPYFRQLAARPSLRSSRQYSLGGRLQMNKFMPASWRVNMPLSVAYSNSTSEPVLLPSTDISGERLTGLRTPAASGLRMDLQLSRQPGADTPLMGWLLDNSALRLSYAEASSRTSRSETTSDGITVNYNFRSDVADLSFPFFPGKDWRFRLTPLNFQFNANFVDTETESRRYLEIVSLPGDTAVQPILALDKRLQVNTNMNFELVPSLTGNFAFVQAQELAPTNYLVGSGAARSLINAERSNLLGIDLGWTTGQNLNMNWSWRPDVASWLTPLASVDSRYQFNRGASYVSSQAGDTTLTSDFGNSRALRASMGFNLPVLFRSMFGDGSSRALNTLLGALDRFDLVSFSWVRSLASQYQRQDARPDVGYRFGFGGFNSFLVQDGDTASRVADSDGITLSSGFRFPLGLGLNVDYSDNDALIWTPVTKTRNHSVAWPNLTLNWSRLPLPASFERWVANAGIRIGYSVRSSSSDIARSQQLRESETRTIPMSVNLALTTEWSFSYSLDLAEDERRDPTGVTFGDRQNHSFQVSGRLRPLSAEGRFRNPIRISLRLGQDSQKQCRRLGDPYAAPGAGDGATPAECEPFTDLRIRRVDLTVGTDIPPFALGLQGSWRDTQSEIGQRPGNTQLEFTFFGQFLLETGEIR